MYYVLNLGKTITREYERESWLYDKGIYSSLTEEFYYTNWDTLKSNDIDICTSNINFYQPPLILTELFQHNLINVSYLTACYLYQVMMTLRFLNDVANGAESTQKSKITS